MPILSGPSAPPPAGSGVSNSNFGDVASRTRSILNDDGAQLWSDALLLNHIRNAYTWAFNNIAKYVDVGFEKMTSPDLTYTPTTPGQEQDLGSILPKDFYLPIDVQFRLNTQEEWQAVQRRDRLPERSTQIPDRIYEWEFRNRSIWTISGNAPGLVRVRYLSTLPLLNVASDPILMSNVVEAMAFRAAHEAYMRRGQVPLGQAAKGNANEFMEQIIDHLVLNDQYVGRRGSRFGDATTDGDITNRSTFFG